MLQLSKKAKKESKIKRKKVCFTVAQEQAQRSAQPYNPFLACSQPSLDIQRATPQEFWARLDQDYFASIESNHLFAMREITTGKDLVKYFTHEEIDLSKYYYQHIAQISPAAIHVMFHGMIKTECQYTNGNLNAEKTSVNEELPGVVPKAQKYESHYVLASYEPVGIPANYVNAEMEDLSRTKISFLGEIVEADRARRPIRDVRLSLITSNDIQSQCQKIMSMYNRSVERRREKESKSQIESQIDNWRSQLRLVNIQNQINWRLLMEKVDAEPSRAAYNPYEVQEIRERLMWATILKYFITGMRDKTQQQLNALIQSLQHSRPPKRLIDKFGKCFETDCKVCFCSYNHDSNQVLYCDQCNTSFHQACYGLRDMPIDQLYYCDKCRAVRGELKPANSQVRPQLRSQGRLKKVACQICFKTNFPTKMIQGHYFHVTCLMMFNLVRLCDGQFQLKYPHETILALVIENQLQYPPCAKCGANKGMKLKCKQCPQAAHPICAYINGFQFFTKKAVEANIQYVTFELQCNQHEQLNPERDILYQTYLRRYMCNYKKTASRVFSQFLEEYQAEEQKKQVQHEKKQNAQKLGILTSNKIIRKYIANRATRIESSHSNVETESGKMLLKVSSIKA